MASSTPPPDPVMRRRPLTPECQLHFSGIAAPASSKLCIFHRPVAVGSKPAAQSFFMSGMRQLP